LAESAFLVVPIAEPDGGKDWDGLDRGARMKRLEKHFAKLGAEICARLGAADVEYLEGAGMWTVRSPTLEERGQLVEKLKGLPVEVAPDDRFFAL
jgi:hypothetical protein